MQPIEDIATMLQGLGDPHRLQVALILMDPVDHGYTISELITALDRPEDEIVGNLKQLELTGIVQSNTTSIYRVTKLGRQILSGIWGAYNNYHPKLPIKKTY